VNLKLNKVLAGASATVLAGATLVTSWYTFTPTENLYRPTVSVSTNTTGPSATVRACVHDLKVWRLSDDNEQKADRATVTCSKITTNKDAKVLNAWIKGTGKYSTHKWALEIVG